MFNKIIKRGARKAVPKSKSLRPSSSSIPIINHSSLLSAPAPAPAPAPTNFPGAVAELSVPLPLLRDASVADRPSLFLPKLQICSLVFDFSDPNFLRYAREKEVKRQGRGDDLRRPLCRLRCRRLRPSGDQRAPVPEPHPRAPVLSQKQQ